MRKKGIRVGDTLYLPSKTLAARVHLVPDYVTRLARTGAVQGIRQNGIWYINPENLQKYLQGHDAHKKEINERTSIARRAERYEARQTALETRAGQLPILTLPHPFFRIAAKRRAAVGAAIRTGAAAVASAVLLVTGSHALAPLSTSNLAAAASTALTPFDSIAVTVFHALCPLFSSCKQSGAPVIAFVPIPAASSPSAHEEPDPRPIQTIINQPVVERIVERAQPAIVPISPVTLQDLFALENRVDARIAALSLPVSFPQSIGAAGIPIPMNAPAPAAQRIDQLNGVTITNPHIIGGDISGTAGITAALPDDASFVLATITDATTTSLFSSSASFDSLAATSATTTNLVVTGSLTVPSLSFTGLALTDSTTTNATTTNLFAQNLSLGSALAVRSGGTGTSTAPVYGQVLLGNATGGYDLVATSSLGIIGGGGGSWGSITGTLSSQTDLQSALDAKLSLSDWYATTTDQLKEGSSNLYFTPARALAQFVQNLAATTSVASITSLPNLSLPSSQVSGLFSYLFPNNATTTGLGIYASTTIGNGTQAGGLTVNGGATTTGNIAFTGLGSAGLLYANAGGAVSSVSTSTWSFASSTLLADSNTFSGANVFNGLLSTGSTTVSDGIASLQVSASGGSTLGWNGYQLFLGGNSFLTLAGANPYIESADENGLLELRSHGATGGVSFMTDGIERFRVAGSGHVGVGTSSPIATFSVAGNTFLGGNLTATGTIALTALGSGFVGASNGTLYTFASSSLTAASSTLLADSNTFSGTNTFVNTISGSVTGNAGTVTNGVYTTTFNGLFDPRFVTDLAATTSVASITSLPNLSLPSSQVAGIFGYLFPNNATTTGLGIYASSTIGNGTASGGLTVNGNATTTGLLNVLGSGTSTILSNIGISGSITPSADNTYSLGSSLFRWKDLFVGPGSIYVNNQEVLHTDPSQNVVVGADPNQSLLFQTSGTGDIELNPTGTGVVYLKSNILVSGGKTVNTSDNSALVFTDGLAGGNLQIAANAITATNTNGGISLSPNGSGGVYVTNGSFGIGTTNPGTKLEVNGTASSSGLVVSTLSGLLKANGTSAVTAALAGTDYVAPASLSSYFALSDWYSTTTDQLKEGANNLYFTPARALAQFIANLAATTSVASITTLPNLSITNSQVSNFNTGVNSFISSSTTIPKTYTANTFTNTNTFAGGLTVASLNGPLQANAGVVSATSSIGVIYGGTGLTNAPSYGQLLLGQTNGTYALVATSSLGIVGTGGSGGGQLIAVYATSTVGTTTVNFAGAAGSSPSFSAGTLTLPSNASYLVVEVWGAGGGGGGGGTSGGSGGNGGNGAATCFGTNAVACAGSALTATGGGAGIGGFAGTNGGAGGTGSNGDVGMHGSNGGGGATFGTAVSGGFGGIGGAAPAGGKSSGSAFGGGGVGGDSNASNGLGGGGGGGGGYARKLFTSLNASYTFTVGSGGGGGSAGTSGNAGSIGGPGGIVISVYTTGVSQGAIGGGTAGYLPYYTDNTASTSLSATSTLFLATSGNFGIGTTSPFAKLSVAGSGFFNGNLTAANVVATGTLNVSGLSTLGNASSTLFSSSYASSTSAFFGNLSIGNLTGILKATAGAISTSLVNLASDVTGILGVANGGTGWSNFSAGSLIFGNGSSALATSSSLYWDNANSFLGIATTSPSGKLSIDLSGINDQVIFGLSAGNYLSIKNNGAGGSPRFESGNNIIFRFSTTTGSTAGASAGNQSLFLMDANGTTNVLLAATGTVNSYLAANGGNVGIGTTTPQSQFVIQGATSATSTSNPYAGTLLDLFTTTNATGSTAGMRMHTASGWNVQLRTSQNDNWLELADANGTVRQSWYGRLYYPGSTSNNGANTGYISGDGMNVGVGTFVPKATLHVAASTSVATLPALGSSNNASLFMSNSDLSYGLLMGNLNNGNVYEQAQRVDGTGTAYNLLLQPNGGNVGIGTTTPAQALNIYNGYLQIDGSVSPGVILKPTSGSQYVFGTNSLITGAGIYDSTGGVWRLIVQDTTGNVGIGTSNMSTPNPGVVLNPIGVVRVGNNAGASGFGFVVFTRSATQIGSITQNGTTAVAYNTTSDRRVKENIATTTLGIDQLMQLPVRQFDFISDPTHATTTGFIAQELEPIFPWAVTTNGDNGLVPLGASSTPWSVDYGRVTPLIVKAVQDVANIAGVFRDNLIAWLGDAGNGIDKLFAKEIHAQNVFADEVDAGKLCAKKSDGSYACVTGDQLALLLAGAAAPAATPASGTQASSTPAALTINGNNPAQWQLNTPWQDNLGALFTHGGTSETIYSTSTIDTTVVGTSTIDYWATYYADPTATSSAQILHATRQVVVIAPLSSTSSTSSYDTASTTATSTTP